MEINSTQERLEPVVKTETLIIKSKAFEEKGVIPARYTCDAENMNPPISIERIPAGTKSLAIIVDDPDAPKGTFDHWLIWNIEPTDSIPENAAPGIEGKNSFGTINYEGPCPPSGKPHRYFFKVYALDALLDVKEGADKKTLEAAISKHIIAKGEIIGLYSETKEDK
ncbi:MAG TPA: YbhB/YbcL family Raf kinase inhibitor-like protein [Bacteroidia bacterium]|jgi:hypothetical protein